jgi:DNA-binding response OmpR family regulator
MSRCHRVLVVEDERQIAHVIAAVVAKEADQVVIADTLRSAWWEISQRAFDLVLLDLHLPDSSIGNSVMAIRSFLEAGVHRVVIVTGAKVDDDFTAFAMEAGASGVICKGVTGLADALHNAVIESGCPA